MFRLVQSEDPSKWKAQISEDNLTIEWPKGPNGELTEPPWMELFMERYAKEFYAALSDFRSSPENWSILTGSSKTFTTIKDTET